LFDFSVAGMVADREGERDQVDRSSVVSCAKASSHAQRLPDHFLYHHQSNMGHCAKYFISEARAIACKERKAAYEKTEMYVF